MTKWVAIAGLALVAGCATRITSGVYTDGDGGAIDPFLDLATRPPDLAEPIVIDLATPRPTVDLAQAGKSCGEIVTCALGCGASVGACQLMCFTGASPAGQQQAEAIITCAAQKCLADLQGGMQGAVLTCVITSCGSEVAMCQGFGGGI